jgi:hypothetical protein
LGTIGKEESGQAQLVRVAEQAAQRVALFLKQPSGAVAVASPNEVAVIPPGEHHTTLAPGWAGMGRRPGVEVAFTHRAGVHWLRSADGRLRRIGSPPAHYYRLPEPLPWELP